MAKNYLRSDMSKEEAHFITSGNGIFGEENSITELYKIIGKFCELRELGRKKELLNYIPERDLSFKYENRGITELSSELKIKYGEKRISRKNLKSLSRKWCLSPVSISFNCTCIITELVTYINHDADLKTACTIFISRIGGCRWENIMPIQFCFLSTRFTDQHKNYQKAGVIINELSTICF